MNSLVSDEEVLYSKSEFVGEGCGASVFSGRITKENWPDGPTGTVGHAYSACLHLRSAGGDTVEYYFSLYPGTDKSEISRSVKELRKLASLVLEFAAEYERVVS